MAGAEGDAAVTTIFHANDETDYALAVRAAEAIRRFWKERGAVVEVRVCEVPANRKESTWGVRSSLKMGKP